VNDARIADILQRRARHLQSCKSDGRFMSPVSGKQLNVAIIAPSLGILEEQAARAGGLLRAWRDDPEVGAWLVRVNPTPPGPFRHALALLGWPIRV
jgi:hypothetical protein